MERLAPVMRDAPYSGEQTMRRTRALPDGTKIAEKVGIVQMFRDSSGRRRLDYTQPGPAGEPGLDVIEIRDYVDRLEYTLDVANHVAHRMKFISGAGHDFPVVLPRGRFVPEPTSTPERRADPVRRSLGTRTIEGLICDGTEEVETIPVAAAGNDKPIAIERETWVSRELNIRVESTVRDPRNGDTVTRMTHILLEEPAAVLFQIPPGYRIQDEAGRYSIEVVNPAIGEAERPVRALIRDFADARNLHDGSAAAAAYASEGEHWVGTDLIAKGNQNLARDWGDAQGQASRTVQKVHLVSQSLAIAFGEARLVAPRGALSIHEVFTLTLVDGHWRILIHHQQTVD
jgi:ketosteroid isomerase-like protein